MRKYKCINPKGKEGVCYTFDKFGGRSGCLGCRLYAYEMFEKEDPLPGLTKLLNKGKSEVINNEKTKNSN